MPFDAMARHSMDFWLSSEDLPNPDNRIFYDGDRVVLDITDSNREAHHRLKKKLEQILALAGAHPKLFERSFYLGKNIPIGGTAHQAGTARFRKHRLRVPPQLVHPSAEVQSKAIRLFPLRVGLDGRAERGLSDSQDPLKRGDCLLIVLTGATL